MSDDRKLHWMKFYVDDFTNDPCLRRCSFAAQGLWLHLLAWMYRHSPRRGYLLNPDGTPPTHHDIRRQFGGSSVNVRSIIRLTFELECAKVFSRTDDGIIFSRRIVRMEAERQLRSVTMKAVKRARRNPPIVCETNRETSGDLSGDLEVDLLASSLFKISEEERVQREEEKVSPDTRKPIPRSTSQPTPPWSAAPTPEPDHTLVDVAIAYNEERRGRMEACSGAALHEHVDTWREEAKPLEWWRSVFKRAAESSFVRGDKGGWFGDLRFCIEHRHKILAGKYDRTADGVKAEIGPKPPELKRYVPKPDKVARGGS